MQSAQLPDQLMAGAQKEMIGVAEDDAGVEIIPARSRWLEAFDGGLGADGHEDRRRDVAVRGVQDAGAGARDRTFGLNFEGDLGKHATC